MTRVIYSGPRSTQAVVTNRIVRYLVRPTLRRVPITPAALAAGQMVDLSARILRPRKSIRSTPVRIGHLRGLETPAPDAQAAGRGLVLYFHGGGFVAGGLHTHRRIAATLSTTTNLPVV
ncbi:alpha/beta hydrolase fold domain-containing protein [Gordonia sp. SID5947]|nr:alpha/beta hydrolase fold domain-containing protein [Gordonia sp. SID5947]